MCETPKKSLQSSDCYYIVIEITKITGQHDHVAAAARVKKEQIFNVEKALVPGIHYLWRNYDWNCFL